MAELTIGVLGTLKLEIDGRAASGLEGAVRRRLLALLVARRGLETRSDWLADALWGDQAGDASSATLQSHVAHLRRVLEPDRGSGAPPSTLRTVPGGYLLCAERVEVDADRFVVQLRRSQEWLARGSLATALTAANEAIALVRGEPFEEFGDVEALQPDRAGLEGVIETAVDLRLELLERLGRFGELRSVAAAALRAQPLRERAAIANATALAATGHAAEALRSLHLFRRRLAEVAGLDTSADIASTEQRILRGDVARTANGWEAAVGTQHRAVVPPLRYARAGDGVSIAYQEVGRGPAFVAVPPLAQNIEICWQDGHHRRLLERAAERCRFVHFDKRGTGMSDRAAGFTLDERLGDFLAVMDAAGIERAVVCGVSEAGPLAIAFAAAHPERVAALYLVNTFARVIEAHDYPEGVREDEYVAVALAWEAAWGSDDGRILDWFAPSRRGDRAYEAWIGHYMRQSCSPGTLHAINQANGRIDVRGLLPQLRVPTVVVHRSGDRVTPIAWGRYLASNIPGAEFREFHGVDHLPWIGDSWREIIDGGVELALRHA